MHFYIFFNILNGTDETRTRNLDLGKVLPYHWATPARNGSIITALPVTG